jgi:hypothetical protein
MEGLTCLESPPERMWCPDDNMADYPHILFNKSPSQLRLLGARGGKAYGRNQRARRARLTTSPAAIPVRVPPRETTARAIAVLDARFPWLAGWGGLHQSRRKPGVFARALRRKATCLEPAATPPPAAPPSPARPLNSGKTAEVGSGWAPMSGVPG